MRRILKRLVLALGHAEQNNFRSLAEIVLEGQTRLPTFSTMSSVELGEIPVGHVLFDHPRVEMAGAAGHNLLHRKSVLLQPDSIVFSLESPVSTATRVARGKAPRVFSSSAVLPEPGELMRLTQNTRLRDTARAIQPRRARFRSELFLPSERGPSCLLHHLQLPALRLFLSSQFPVLSSQF